MSVMSHKFIIHEVHIKKSILKNLLYAKINNY